MGRKTVFDPISFKQITEEPEESESQDRNGADRLDLIDDPDLLTNRENLVKSAHGLDNDY